MITGMRSIDAPRNSGKNRDSLATLRYLSVWFCLAVFPFASAIATSDELVFCFEDDNVRPWQTKNGSGLSFDLLELVAADVRLRFQYRAAPWKRCFFDLKGKVYDGIISVSFKPDRLEFGHYPGGNKPDTSKAIYVERYVVARRKGTTVNWNGRSFEKLAGMTGAQLGYSVIDDLRRSNVPVDDGARTSSDVLNKLVTERIDAAIMLQGELSFLLAESAALRDKVEVLPIPFAEKPYYLMLSNQLVQNRPELAARIWSSVARQRANPAYIEKERRALGLVK
ncbi:MAG: polar amino acid transport system substrate-binding protein [Pseudomonadota bacterium]|nr:polar amino acid transport system substrate-binding protein [Pseudomonadota bacterium]MDQ5882426.1 polar amino acid transport system substrate-binding protein [Pseudomonadota bacterium]MDQ5903046.1 polar amino acid transport system substrate-binding protein [Pseudomonadota bacterium]MDQ5907001.1 polar amino acid transport system substrate-binding protein [Pseudomonadota bacterium]MDQ5918710.1 polar amino acid transport system substrate-binding protein [Pseudomonadota bacterium]